MAAKKETTKQVEMTALEALAVKLDALEKEATALGEERVAKRVSYAAKSARYAEKQREVRVKRVGGMVAAMKAKGLSDAEIVAQLTR